MKKYTPFFTAIIFISLIAGILEYIALKKTNNQFCYPLDDTFIHMAMARNIAQNGTWGINPGEYSATSSSPLYTALLSITMRISSNTLLWPLLLAMAGSVLLIWCMQRELNHYTQLTNLSKTAIIIGSLLMATTPVLAVLGMEHTLQNALVLLFVHSITSVLTSSTSFNNSKALKEAAIWASLMTLARYESLFFLAGAAGLLLLQKKWKAVVIVFFAGLLPVALFGVYSVSHGGYFFPNSIMIKSNQTFLFLLNGGYSLIEKTGSFSGLVVLAFIIAFQKYRNSQFDRDFWALCLFLIASLFHAAFISLSWFYRYESYLIAVGGFTILKILITWIQDNGWKALYKHIIPASITFLLLYSLQVRGLNALKNTTRGIVNIHDQQTQMGQFLKQYYPGKTIAANDVGAISYYAPVRVLDLWGLGNNEVMQARKNKTWGGKFLGDLATRDSTQLAVIYDSWFDSTLTHQWTKVASWEISNNLSCGDSKVSFYSISPNNVTSLQNKLKTYQKQLPTTVSVNYY